MSGSSKFRGDNRKQEAEMTPGYRNWPDNSITSADLRLEKIIGR